MNIQKEKNKCGKFLNEGVVEDYDVDDVENNIIRGEIAHSKTRDHTSM
jgi:hypothetical protein